MTLYEAVCKTAIVIKIGNKYFERCTKRSTLTTHLLADAKMYIPNSMELKERVELLTLRKKKFELITIGIINPTILE